MTIIAILLGFTAVVGTGVALTRDPKKQALVLGVYGLIITILFFALHSPDVAFSQLTVGGGVLPMMVVVALSRTQGKPKKPGEEVQN